jgi:hypothetical protein
MITVILWTLFIGLLAVSLFGKWLFGGYVNDSLISVWRIFAVLFSFMILLFVFDLSSRKQYVSCLDMCSTKNTASNVCIAKCNAQFRGIINSTIVPNMAPSIIYFGK